MDFYPILKASGIPTTQAELETRWRTLVDAAALTINNDNKMSPFWRFVTAAVTTPVLWLTDTLANTVLPNAFVKTATGTFLDLLAWAVNLERKPATKAAGVVRFTRSNTALAITVPAGTVVETPSINGVVYRLITQQDATFVGSNATLDVSTQAEAVGAAYNLAAGYYNILPDPITGVTAVANPADWITQPGTDIETDAALRARIRNQFGTASSFHTDSVYRALIGQFAGVDVDAIWFEHNAPRGPGTANAYVLFDFAAPVSQYLTQINQYITDDGHHGHGDDLIVYQMPEQTRTLTVTVYCEKFLTSAEQSALQAGVTDFVNAAFRENKAYTPTLTYPYSRFSFSKLGDELHSQFAGIHSVVFSLGDIVTGKWIPRLTSLTVTVEETE